MARGLMATMPMGRRRLFGLRFEQSAPLSSRSDVRSRPVDDDGGTVPVISSRSSSPSIANGPPTVVRGPVDAHAHLTIDPDDRLGVDRGTEDLDDTTPPDAAHRARPTSAPPARRG